MTDQSYAADQETLSPHAMTIAHVETAFDAGDPEHGLSLEDIAARQKKYGHNALPETKLPGPIALFLYQFKSPFIYVLMAAAMISVSLGHQSDALFIFIVLTANALIGSIQEYSAQKAATALKKMIPQTVTVLRGGKVQSINARELVPGDTIQLTSGDSIAADIRLISTSNLAVDESILTGESMEVSKDAAAVLDEEIPLGDRQTMAWTGTIVARGRGTGIVTAIGAQTQMGRIAGSLALKDETKPPLLQRIERFTIFISLAMFGLILAMLVIFALRGEPLTDVFLVAIANKNQTFYGLAAIASNIRKGAKFLMLYGFPEPCPTG